MSRENQEPTHLGRETQKKMGGFVNGGRITPSQRVVNGGRSETGGEDKITAKLHALKNKK